MNWTIFRVELWVLWRLTASDLAGRLVATLLILTMGSFMDSILSGWLPVDDGSLAFMVILLLGMAFDGLRQSSGSAGFPFAHNFSGPLSTPWLVLLPLSWLLLTNTALYLLLVAFANFLSGISLPGLAMVPTILLATTVVTSVAWTGNGLAARIAGSVAAMPVFLWLMMPDTDQFVPLVDGNSSPEAMFHVSRATHIVMGAGTALCALACVCLVGLHRSGEEAAPLSRLKRALDRLRTTGVRARPFASPGEAQRWFERRRSFRRSLAVVLAGLGAILLGALVYNLSDRSPTGVLFWSSALILTPPVLLACTVEAVSGISYRGTYSYFSIYQATLPISVPDSVRFKFLAALRNVTIGTLVLASAGLCAASTISGGTSALKVGLRYVLGSDRIHALLAAGVTLIASVALCAAFVLLAMSLRYAKTRGSVGVANRSMLFLAIPIALATFFSLLAIGGWDLEFVRRLSYVASAFALMRTTVVSLRHAVQVGLYRARTLAGIVASGGLIMAAPLALLRGPGDYLLSLPMDGGVLVLGLLSILIAGVAWAPLTLAALRHQ